MFKKLEFQAEEMWTKLSPDQKEQIQKISGLSWDSHTTDFIDKVIILEQAANYFYVDREWKKKEKLANEMTDRLLEGLGTIIQGMTSELKTAYTESARIMADGVGKAITQASEVYNKTLAQNMLLIESIQEKSLTDNEVKLLPQYASSTTNFEIGDCVYQHPKIKTPTRIVVTTSKDGKLVEQCKIAAHAYSRTFLGIQMFSGRKLEEGGCPLYTSRGMIERFFPGNRCRLADGGAHYLDIKDGKKTILPIWQQTIDRK